MHCVSNRGDKVHYSAIGMSPEPAAARRAAAASGCTARRGGGELRQIARQTAVVDPDAGLRAAAQRLLARSPFLGVRSIRCEARDGVLTLRGRVASFYLKQIALATVRKLEQAREVRNEVDVCAAPGRATMWADTPSPGLPR